MDCSIAGLKFLVSSNLAREISQNPSFKSHKSFVKTTAPRQQVVFGNFKTDVIFKNSSNEVNFYVVPSLSQEIILGIDFWSIFKIAPNIVSEVYIKTESELSYDNSI